MVLELRREDFEQRALIGLSVGLKTALLTFARRVLDARRRSSAPDQARPTYRVMW